MPIALMLSAMSCERFFEPSQGNKLENGENYSDRSTVYSSFIGLYSILQDAVPDLIVLSELRGDLISPTTQAPDEYWNVYRNRIQKGNSVANPAFLYELVVNCNDFLRNTIEYNTKYPGVITTNIYKQMIAGTVCLRTWAYLNIGKLYGKAVYYDYAMTGETELADAPVLEFDDLIRELISFMQTGVDNISGLRNVNVNNMFGTSGIWSNIPINPDALMLELYLWNKDYENAAKRGLNMITGQAITAAGDNHSYTCSYQFGSNKNGLKKWQTLFSETPVAVHGKEGASIVLYDYSQRQPNPLYSLCSNESSCDHWLRPTSALVSRFSGKDYKSGVNTIQDPRGSGVTYETVDGDRLFYKYIVGRSIQTQDAPIYLYRAGEIHLMVAEALVALGNYDAAEALLNEGFQPYWEAGNRYYAPFDAPIYAYEKLRMGHGLRGRLDIPAIESESERFMGKLTTDSLSYNDRRAFVLDSLIIEETGRELAGEGKRWFTMMRIARNMGYDELLANLISSKYDSGNAGRYEEFMDRNNWFIDYNFEK